MLESIINNYAFNLMYAQGLIADVPDEKMCEQPANLKNHPAWTIGHLAWAARFALMMLEIDPPASDSRYAMHSKPSPDRSIYPAKLELVNDLETQHARVAEVMRSVAPETLALPTPDEDFRTVMPTIGDALVFLLTTHESVHLGQLSNWRKAMDLPPVRN